MLFGTRNSRVSAFVALGLLIGQRSCHSSTAANHSGVSKCSRAPAFPVLALLIGQRGCHSSGSANHGWAPPPPQEAPLSFPFFGFNSQFLGILGFTTPPLPPKSKIFLFPPSPYFPSKKNSKLFQNQKKLHLDQHFFFLHCHVPPQTKKSLENRKIPGNLGNSNKIRGGSNPTLEAAGTFLGKVKNLGSSFAEGLGMP